MAFLTHVHPDAPAVRRAEAITTVWVLTFVLLFLAVLAGLTLYRRATL